jgi:hypothetical protein
MPSRFTQPNTNKDALELCHEAGKSRRFTLASAAKERCEELGLSTADVRHLLQHAKRCTRAQGIWNVQGPSLDGGTISLSVAFDAAGVVVL